METKKLLGRKIKEIRKSKGLTQENLSELVGIETSTLSGVESGRFFPSLHVLDKISKQLDVPLVKFFEFTSVDIPENIEEILLKNITKQSKANKVIIYKLLENLFPVI